MITIPGWLLLMLWIAYTDSGKQTVAWLTLVAIFALPPLTVLAIVIRFVL
jgi:hypothetical protein